MTNEELQMHQIHLLQHILALLQQNSYNQRELHKAIKKNIYDNYKKNICNNLPDNSLLHYGYKMYSQNEEDGIIQEIFNRIGTTNKLFVEIGVEYGHECNTRALLLKNWKGVWIDAREQCINHINTNLNKLIDSKILTAVNSFVNKDNIEHVIKDFLPNGTNEIDLFSLDIDGYDAHLFPYAKCINPRVIIAEYNGKYPVDINVSVKYDTLHVWDYSDYVGASLTYLNEVLDEMNYTLVACELTGTNAFYVRNDLIKDNMFDRPGDIEYHWKPAMYNFSVLPCGHEPNSHLKQASANQTTEDQFQNYIIKEV